MKTSTYLKLFALCFIVACAKKKEINTSISNKSTEIKSEFSFANYKKGTYTEKINQPYSSYWFIADFLKWDSKQDPNAPFNISNTPLATRFIDKTTQIRPELSNEPSIISLIASHPTSNHPSQGFQTIKQYAFPYWQYIDYMVQWGGSSAEGIIVTPAMPWIDAAHRNGVRILGTVFFPPNVYGGKEEWVREFLAQDENGKFPVADKMLEVAGFYNFDGWFINQETHGLNAEEAQKMQLFLKYYQDQAKGKFKLMWYDAMIEDGRVIWQDEFNEHNAFFFQQEEQKLSDILFIDFGWSAVDLEDSNKKLKAVGRSPWEAYAGIDVQSKSYKSWANWDGLYDGNSKPYTTSIGLYWPNSTFDIAETKEPEEVYENEQIFWNGGYKFETRFGEAEWKGFTDYFPARSVINSLPFVSNFNYGLGRFYNEAGKRVSSKEWHNLSIQDILPTWQWDTDSSIVKPTFDFTDSYTGGSCLKFEVDGKATIPLYKSSITLNKVSELSTATKMAGNINTEIVGLLADGSTFSFPLKQTSAWQISSKKSNDLKGKKLVKLSIRFEGKGTLWLGELKLNADKKNKLPKPLAQLYKDEGSRNAYIEIGQNSSAKFHECYAIMEDGTKTWLGRSTSYHLYIPEIPNGAKHLVLYPISEARAKGKPITLK